MNNKYENILVSFDEKIVYDDKRETNVKEEK